MALPPGFLDELRSRLTLSDIVGRKVLWDNRKSNPARGDFWSPCPFHQEKTPSFHVDDRKGFYYCFGCHEKGDMISFVRETENVSFVEAIEILAREAGLEMPEATRDPHAAEKRDRLAQLADVMEQAVRAFQIGLRSGVGQAARSYAEGRGLDEATLRRFEIGYAPSQRGTLSTALGEKGLLDDGVEAGLLIRPDDGGTPFDRFRDRLMFPIRDTRGRCVGFGGRAMSPNAQAKYLNSPETPLFHKGRVLYNHANAREASGKTGTLIVAEGYMDVIALAQAGFDHAVAPLGTAITEDQLGLIWRMADEPIIALDGDKAGLRAAERLIDLALPLLTPGKSLRFCILPEGQDPDDLIKAGGAAAMADALEQSVPMAEMLWRRETGRGPLDTPERKAAFDAALRKLLGTITDKSVRSHYGADMRERRAALLAPRARQGSAPQRPWQGSSSGPNKGRGTRGASRTGPARETLNSGLVRGVGNTNPARIREATILLIALRNKAALEPLEALLEEMPCTTPDTAAMQAGLMDALAEGSDPIALLHQRLGEDPCALLARVPQVRANPYTRPDHTPDQIAEVLREAIRRHETLLAYEVEVADARRDFADAADERWSTRLRQIAQDRVHADNAASATPLVDEAQDSPLQRLLDHGAWRSRSHKPEKPD